jgi:hypothetical protein
MITSSFCISGTVFLIGCLAGYTARKSSCYRSKSFSRLWPFHGIMLWVAMPVCSRQVDDEMKARRYELLEY